MNHAPTLWVLQALRALAAALVVCCHVAARAAQLYGTGAQDELFQLFGRMGFGIFFVISGYIMVHTTHALPTAWASARGFMRRRILRVVPLYWLFTTLVLVLVLAAPTLFREMQWDTRQIIASYLFVQVTNNMGNVGPLIGLGWTLNFEMYFYLVFAGALLLRSRIAALTLFLSASVAIGCWLKPTSAAFQLMTSPLLLEFLAGTLAAQWMHRRNRIPAWLGIAGFIGLLISIHCMRYSPYVSLGYGSCIALIIGALVTREREGRLRIPRLFAALGDSSYSLYLSHVFTLAILARAWQQLGTPLNPAAFGILTVIALIASGHAVYRLIERPMTQRLQRHFKAA